MPEMSSVIANQWLLVPLLGAVIYFDLRLMRLPNLLSWLFVLVFLVSLPWAADWRDAGFQVLAAAIVFAIGLAANAAKLVGGGDVKVLAALVLNIPTGALLLFFGLLCGALFFGILVLELVRRRVSPPTGWRALDEKKGRFPVGLSIGLAGLAHIAMS
ncbi:hypothetical protein HKCCE4037_09385 [Rhodobacterales bacterium HKCCE4037]|nr:hypothetical protein [Rhodobacterales bacterium HKCCE4037]